MARIHDGANGEGRGRATRVRATWEEPRNGTVENEDARLVTPTEAIRLMERGYRAADLHAHSCSMDTVPHRDLHPAEMLRSANDHGLSYLAFTDHNEIPTFWFEGEGVVRGVEVDVLDVDYVGHTVHELVYGLSEEQHRDLMTIAAMGDLRAFADYCNLRGLWLCYAHPFWAKGKEKLNAEAIPRVARLNHLIEVNESVTRPQNGAARQLARALGMPELANSDTHTAGLGGTFTLARGDTFPEWIENVRRGDYYLRLDHLDRHSFRREVRRWLELAFRFDPQGPDAYEQVEQRCFWDCEVVDKFLRCLIRGRLSELPHLREWLWTVARALLNLGVSDLHVLSEMRRGRKLGGILGNGDKIRRLAQVELPRPVALEKAATRLSDSEARSPVHSSGD